jgi:hypothetical protein
MLAGTSHCLFNVMGLKPPMLPKPHTSHEPSMLCSVAKTLPSECTCTDALHLSSKAACCCHMLHPGRDAFRIRRAATKGGFKRRAYKVADNGEAVTCLHRPSACIAPRSLLCAKAHNRHIKSWQLPGF